MRIDANEVGTIAKLARLAVDADDIPIYADNLSKIIEFINQLDAADTDSVAPMAHPLSMAQRLRPDEVTEGDRRERYQQNAPAVEAGLYLVPRVIE
jgi:aspartyl-tRNA(Asn)/glutamyl-tRNA(Gln) amidotransferase subunit C